MAIISLIIALLFICSIGFCNATKAQYDSVGWFSSLIQS